MTEHRPLTRSRSKKFKKDGTQSAGLDPAFAPPPLNIRKANAPVKQPQTQRVDIAAIGVAVGSPKNSPLPPLPKQHQHQNSMEHFQFPFPSPSRPRGSTDISGGSRDSKSKGSRWKSLGSFFSKREPTPRQEERLRHNDAPPTRPVGQLLMQESSQSSRKRAGSDKEKAMEQQRLAQAAPQLERRPSLMRRASAKRKASQRRKPGQVRVEMNRSNRNSVLPPGSNTMARVSLRQNALLKGHEDFSLLGIEIPNVELERYSVMFSNVLRDSPNASKTSLVRPYKGVPEAVPQVKTTHTGTISQEATLEDALEPPKPRQREGSVSSTSSKTPSFSLFPSTTPLAGRAGSPARNVGVKPLPKPSPLSRAVTAPDPSNLQPRPPLKPNRSDDPAQALVQDKENIPVSRWNQRHSRQGSRASSNSHDFNNEAANRPSSRGHIAQLSTERPHSHSRNPSLEPPSSHHQHSQSQSKYLDVSEFSSNNPNMQGPAVRPHHKPIPADQPLRSNPTNTTNANTNTKQAFINRAFPVRKSSMKRLHPSNTNLETTKYTPDSAPMPEPPRPLYAVPGNGAGSEFYGSSESVVSTAAAEVSIARQISISRKQRQLLVPVMAKTARQPLVVSGEEGRKSELVFFESGDSPT